MHQQLWRLAGVFVVAGGTLVAARHYLIPATFGQDGHYRAAAVATILARPVRYAGRTECADCHAEVVDSGRTGNHRGVSCEVCHGPGAVHAESGGDTATRPMAPPRQLCVVCHAYDPSRPTGFPEIDPVEHNALKACTKCHQAHAPVPPTVPEQCRACHGQIDRAKGMSQHAGMACTNCHLAPQQHKVTPRAVAATKPSSVAVCVRCHAQPDATLAGDASQIPVDTHYRRNMCWDCHYPHNPKAS